MSEAPLTPRAPKLIAICLVAAAALIAADLASKAWAYEELSAERIGEAPPVCQPDEAGYIGFQRARSEPVVVVEDFAELRYAENCGAAFGLLRDANPLVRHSVFGLAAIGAILALGWMFVTGRGGPAVAASVPFIISGAVGNLHDRMVYGYVVDFIRVYGTYDGEIIEWPTFNVADIAITVGVALLLIDAVQDFKRQKALKASDTDGASAEPEADSAA